MTWEKPGLRRAFRGVRRGLVALGCLAIIAVALGFLWLRTSLPTVEGEVVVAGLGAPVAVVRDRHGVPHISARSQADAMFALGFVHAQDRLFQMDMQRRTAAGRLAELLGGRALPFDRWLRTLGFEAAARSSLGAVDAKTRAIFQAYADGVNAVIDGHEGAWPLEYELLRATPERWRPLDSILVLKAMSLLLATNLGDETLRLRLAARLTPSRIAELWPAAPGEASRPLDPFPVLPARQAGSSLSAPGGSNAWALAGSRTASGKPLLANDPHLGLGLPGTWYLASLEAPGSRLVGATIPGMPTLVVGHNGHVAWGFTNTYADTQDLFIERLDPNDPTRVAFAGGGWQPMASRQEIIRVLGAEDVVMTVRETGHGPVLSDVDGELAALVGPGYVVSLAWTALRPGDTTPAVGPRLAEAESVAAFIAATSAYQGPIQNMVVADTAGSIAVVAAGLIPIRGARDGGVPAPGWSDDGAWTGFLPTADLPSIVDPPSGAIVTANNRWMPDGYAHAITRDWAPPYRAARILELLDRVSLHTLESMRSVQSDQVSLVARELLPFLLNAKPATPASAAALGLLASWDGTMAPDLPQPLIFSAWFLEVQRRILADDVGSDLASEPWVSPRFLFEALSGSKATWCDDVATEPDEECGAIVTEALETAMAGLAERYGPDPGAWRWGDAHHARHAHPILGRLPVVGDLFAVTQPIGGDRYTIAVSGLAGGADDPFRSEFGAGLRAIYDLADLDRSLFVIAVGQSGNPLSPDYANLADRWVGNDPFTIPAVVPEGPGTRSLVLRPGNCDGATPC